MSDYHDISDAELLAYMYGEDLPHVARALADSTELRQQLRELGGLHNFLQKKLAGLERPDPQDLVDVVAGQATPSQKLRVAAYTRASKAGGREFAQLQQEWASDNPAAAPSGVAEVGWLAWFVAAPLAALGVRAGDAATPEQSFFVADIQAQITLYTAVSPPHEAEITGYAAQMGQPINAVAVLLETEQGEQHATTTDESGFFSFAHLSPGHYQLQLELADGVVLIPNISLVDES